jgi:hypothetical protein
VSGEVRHEFVREPWAGLDREARYDQETVFARKLRARQLLGIGLIIVLNAGPAALVYYALGWLGVVGYCGVILAIAFIRGARLES